MDNSLGTAAQTSNDRLVLDLSGSWRLAPIGDTGSGKWQFVQVPSRLNTPGRFSYRKRIVIEPNDARSHGWLISTEGIGGAASVFMNGRLVSAFAGGGMPRILPISEHTVHDGINEIDIQVDNRTSARSTLPITPAIYEPEYPTGLVGQISVVRCSPMHIESLDVSTDPAKGVVILSGVLRNNGEVEVEGTLQLGIGTATAAGQLGSSTEKIRLAPGGSQSFEHSFSGSELTKWAASNPQLYLATASLDFGEADVDVVSRSFGFRSVGIKSKRSIEVNGAPVLLNGTAYLEPIAESDSVRRAIIEADLTLMRSLGINALRTPIHPSEYLLQRCDELGFYVLAELPIQGIASGLIEKDGLSAQADSIVMQAIYQCSRHPSVIAIGLGTDNDDVDPRLRRFYTDLAAIARAHDHGVHLFYFNTRFASSKFALDIAALSTLGLPSESEVADAIHRFARAHQGEVPMIVASNGSFVHVGTPSSSEWSSSLATESRVVNTALQAAQDDQYAGAFVGTLRDYRSAAPALGVPGTGHRLVSCGLVDADNSLRPAARILQARFLGEGRVSLPEFHQDGESTLSFILYGFLLLLIFFVLLNLDRRFREYIIRALTRPFNFFADIRDQRLIPSLQTLLLAIVVSGSFALIIEGVFFSVRERYAAGWLLAKIVGFESLDRAIIYFSWAPVGAFFYGTVGVLLILLLIAGIIRFAAIFVRGRIFYNDTLNVTVWALMPAIVLIPLGMILPRLDHTASTILAAAWVLILLKLWLLYRLMKGVGVLFDIYPTRIYLYCGLGLIVLYGGMFLYWNYASALIANWRFFMHLSSAFQLAGAG